MQKKINFNVPLLGLDGQAVADANGPITIGSLLAPMIAQQTQGDALKLFSWAMAIYKKQDIFLDKSDLHILKELINGNTQLTILVKAQILELMDKAAAE